MILGKTEKLNWQSYTKSWKWC